jgi:hypothetical protein
MKRYAKYGRKEGKDRENTEERKKGKMNMKSLKNMEEK